LCLSETEKTTVEEKEREHNRLTAAKINRTEIRGEKKKDRLYLIIVTVGKGGKEKLKKGDMTKGSSCRRGGGGGGKEGLNCAPLPSPKRKTLVRTSFIALEGEKKKGVGNAVRIIMRSGAKRKGEGKKGRFGKSAYQ